MSKYLYERPVVADHGLVYSEIRMEDNRDSIADTCPASCQGDREGGEWWADRITMALNYFVGMDNEEVARAVMEKGQELVVER